MLQFFTGWVLGVLFGFFVAALCSINHWEQRRRREERIAGLSYWNKGQDNDGDR